jgi:hypothetical protein
MGSLAVLLGFEAADRLGGGPADGAGVVAAQVDRHRVVVDVDGESHTTSAGSRNESDEPGA